MSPISSARHFYEEGLGWRRGNTQKEIVFFQAGGLVVALYPLADLAKNARLDENGFGFGAITLAYNVRQREDVDAVLTEARAAGAPILKPAEDDFWAGCSGYFADLDGHPWEVAWNPHWTMVLVGAVRMPAAED